MTQDHHKPVFSQKSGTSRTSYQLPNRIHVARVYPVVSPNGSTPIIYGHDSGLTIIWRGGRPLKSSSGGTQGGTQDDDQVFESEEKELDPSSPCPPIVQSLDFAIGAEVLDISVPCITPTSAFRRSDSSPAIFAQEILLAAACSDCIVRVVLLPLLPPTDTQKSQGLGDVVAQISHRSIPTSVSLSWTSQALKSWKYSDELDMEQDQDQDGKSSPQKASEAQNINLLIASGSSDASSTISISRVSLREEGGETSFALGERLPFQKLRLPSPSSSPLNLSFSPAQHPSNLHSQLLVSHAEGSVRIYNPFHSRQKAVPSQGDTPEQGSWIASFSTGFTAPNLSDDASAALARRKRLLDAKWTCGGRAIIALLEMGEWGLWDVDGSAPGSASSAPPREQNAFALWGILGSGIPSNPSTTLPPTKRPRGSRSSLAPMTPNTRRVREDALFGPMPEASTGPARGGISVFIMPLSSVGSTEDSAMLWYNDKVYTIASVQAFWSRVAKDSARRKGQASGGSLFGPGLARVEGLDLHGEFITSVSQIPSRASGPVTSNRREVVLSTQHRLIILSSPQQRSADQVNSLLFDQQQQQQQQQQPLLEPPRSSIDHNAAQRLLLRGELDIAGLDSMLDNIDRGVNNDDDGDDDIFMTSALPRVVRRVGFAA